MKFWVEKKKTRKGDVGCIQAFYGIQLITLSLTLLLLFLLCVTERFIWSKVSFANIFKNVFFFYFPKFSFSIIFTRCTSAIQNQTANIISSRKRPKMTICLTSLFDHSENCLMRLLAWTKRHTNHKIRFFRKFERFFKFFPFVLFSSLLFLIFPHLEFVFFPK